MNIRVNTPLKHGGEIIPAGTVIAPGVIDLSERDGSALVRARAIELTKDDPSPGYEGKGGKKAADQSAAEKAAAEKEATERAAAEKEAADKAAAKEADEKEAAERAAAEKEAADKAAAEKEAAGQADKPKRGGKKSES